jgi:hypothetical protein
MEFSLEHTRKIPAFGNGAHEQSNRNDIILGFELEVKKQREIAIRSRRLLLV